MKQIIQKIFRSFYKAIYCTIAHEGIEHAGYLAFLLMLSIFPSLVFFVALVGFFGKGDLSELLMHLILDSSWANFIDALKPRIIEITSSPPQGLLTIAIVSAMWTASSIFEGLRTILNKAYRVTQTPTYIIRRLLSFMEFAALIVVVIVLMIAILIIPFVWHYVDDFANTYNYPFLNFLVGQGKSVKYLVLLTFGFAFVCGIYYYIPNRKQVFSQTIPGTVSVLLGWAASSALFRLYLNYFPSINIIYGSIAGIIIALLYFYICSLVFIFGAELNYQLEEEFECKEAPHKV